MTSAPALRALRGQFPLKDEESTLDKDKRAMLAGVLGHGITACIAGAGHRKSHALY